MKVWVVGSKGLVGAAMASYLEESGIACIATPRQSLDITIKKEVEDFALQQRPSYIINCAAFTKVDLAENEPEKALQVNALGPLHLAQAAGAVGARFIHISTDYVLKMVEHIPKQEDAELAVINAYGMSKLCGELALKVAAPSACIVRTSWVYGLGGHNFISSLLHLFQKEENVRVVCDQIGRPTFAKDLVKVLWQLKDASGIYHIAGKTVASRYDIARALHAYMQEKGIVMRCLGVERAYARDFPLPAYRPSYSVLDTSKAEKEVGYTPRFFEETLGELFL
jgi:dTDP-4-dehydrorhamnose reductase